MGDFEFARASIHLFRALLREATYLPDPASRVYFRSYITSRFRRHHPASPKPVSAASDTTHLAAQDAQVASTRAWERYKQGKADLLRLQRANDGELKPLLKVLYMTYGRVGKRRADLLDSVKFNSSMSSDVSRDLIDVALKETRMPVNERRTMPRVSEQLDALLKSQLHRSPPTDVRELPKRLRRPTIPPINSWGRPQPVKRVRNIVKRWYADILRSVHAPLPADEWQKLGHLAHGKRPWTGAVQRRPLGASVLSGNENGAISSLSPNLTALERELFPAQHSKHRARGNPHQLTPRYMRRLWLRVFLISPKLLWNHERSSWTVVWGERALLRSRPAVSSTP